MSSWKNVQYKDGQYRTSEGGGASALNDLIDVDTTGVSNNNVLTYSSGQSKWVPLSISPGGNVDDVTVNGTSIVDANKVAQIVSYKELTRAEYDALPDTKLTDGVMYCIKDGFSNPNGFPPLIYSTEEREVGVWTDGKSLYQKTISVTFGTSNTEYEIEYNIDKFMFVPEATFKIQNSSSNVTNYGFYVSATDRVQVYYRSSDHKLIVMSVGSDIAGDGFITYRYTKTTDTAGSGKWATDGGLAKHYSTQEQIIGTWVDGKPLYEKVFTLTSTTLVSANTWTTIYTNSLIGNVNQVVKCLYINSANGGIYDAMFYKPDGNNLQAYYVGPNGYTFSFITGYYIILQYTKTTD